MRQAQVLAQRKDCAAAQALAEQVPARFSDFEQQHEVDLVLGRARAAEGDFEQAREHYRRTCRSPRGAKTETAAVAQLLIGESYFHQQNYAAALREYLAVEILYAYPDLQATALLQAAKCYEQLGEWKQAVALYDRLAQDFPGSQLVEEASRRRQDAAQRVDANADS